jgi:hypothetical protein
MAAYRQQTLRTKSAFVIAGALALLLLCAGARAEVTGQTQVAPTGPPGVITLNPYVAAAKFVVAGSDLDRNVKDAASEIAKKIAARVQNPQ